jgi:two-component system, LytTR family, sensor kinase
VQRDRSSWLVPVLLWGTVVAIAIAAGIYAEAPDMRPPGARGRMLPRIPGPPANLRTLLFQLGVGSVVWFAVATALPFLLWGARRLDIERHGRARTITIAAATIAILVACTAIIEYFVVYGGTSMGPSAKSYLTTALRQNLLPWIAIAGLVAAVEARRRAVHSTIDRERLRAQVAEQRLIALTGQLHPHFLFNTLQGISTLIHRDPDAADEMLAKLADLLRDLLRHRDRVLLPLGDELRYARTYLEIAQLRFADRLRFEIDVPEELYGASVPLFILQPLVENALAHGIGARMQGGRIALSARRRGDRLQLEVRDDGAGLPTATPHEGIGLSNTRERLRASFGADQSLTLKGAEGGGVVASIDIPYRTSAALA